MSKRAEKVGRRAGEQGTPIDTKGMTANEIDKAKAARDAAAKK